MNNLSDFVSQSIGETAFVQGSAMAFFTPTATTAVGERFSRQSFDGGATWSAWIGQ